MTTTSSNSGWDPPRRRWAVPAAAALAAGYLCWILAHFAPAIMSPDANGYVVQARLLATAGRTFLRTESPAQYVGTHWLETTDGVFQSRYPAGLPLLAAAAWKLGGLPAALLVNPLLASGTILLTFFLARRFADDGSALLAAAVLATNATAQQHALDADAHTAAGFFLTAGLVALWHFADRPTWGRGLPASAHHLPCLKARPGRPARLQAPLRMRGSGSAAGPAPWISTVGTTWKTCVSSPHG